MSPPSHLGPYWQVSGLRLEQRKRDLIFYRHECYIRKYSGVFRHYRFSKLPKVYWTLSWFAKKLSQNFSTASDFQFPKNFQEISMLSELPKEFHTEAWWYQDIFSLVNKYCARWLTCSYFQPNNPLLLREYFFFFYASQHAESRHR